MNDYYALRFRSALQGDFEHSVSIFSGFKSVLFGSKILLVPASLKCLSLALTFSVAGLKSKLGARNSRFGFWSGCIEVSKTFCFYLLVVGKIRAGVLGSQAAILVKKRAAFAPTASLNINGLLFVSLALQYGLRLAVYFYLRESARFLGLKMLLFLVHIRDGLSREDKFLFFCPLEIHLSLGALDYFKRKRGRDLYLAEIYISDMVFYRPSVYVGALMLSNENTRFHLVEHGLLPALARYHPLHQTRHFRNWASIFPVDLVCAENVSLGIKEVNSDKLVIGVILWNCVLDPVKNMSIKNYDSEEFRDRYTFETHKFVQEVAGFGHSVLCRSSPSILTAKLRGLGGVTICWGGAFEEFAKKCDVLVITYLSTTALECIGLSVPFIVRCWDKPSEFSSRGLKIQSVIKDEADLYVSQSYEKIVSRLVSY